MVDSIDHNCGLRNRSIYDWFFGPQLWSVLYITGSTDRICGLWKQYPSLFEAEITTCDKYGDYYYY